jgi:hypothetical protein
MVNLSIFELWNMFSYYVFSRLLDKNLVTHMFLIEENVIQLSFLFIFAYMTCCVHCHNI